MTRCAMLCGALLAGDGLKVEAGLPIVQWVRQKLDDGDHRL